MFEVEVVVAAVVVVGVAGYGFMDGWLRFNV